ncbi:MAG TPA: triose-phosphate isomerase [Gemmatimonadales bacterium]|nr:triose-phosphate isomerase [Gemmatimonadales bacterium]
MGRPLIYAANWKMNHGPAAAREFALRFLELTAPQPDRELWFFPPAVSLAPLAGVLRRRPDVRIGAQTIHWEPKGAFTGELSGSLVAEAGATHTLVGHSERRHLFGETEEQSAKKTAAALAAGLIPLVCVGETLAQREAGRTAEAVRRQLEPVLDAVPAADRPALLIAYEPVWAIGTGRHATPADAAEVHRLIRGTAGERGWPGRLRVLYGGSVNAGNALALLAEPEIDGVLVGGASLSADGWAEIVGIGGTGAAG